QLVQPVFGALLLGRRRGHARLLDKPHRTQQTLRATLFDEGDNEDDGAEKQEIEQHDNGKINQEHESPPLRTRKRMMVSSTITTKSIRSMNHLHESGN